MERVQNNSIQLAGEVNGNKFISVSTISNTDLIFSCGNLTYEKEIEDNIAYTMYIKEQEDSLGKGIKDFTIYNNELYIDKNAKKDIYYITVLCEFNNNDTTQKMISKFLTKNDYYNDELCFLVCNIFQNINISFSDTEYVINSQYLSSTSLTDVNYFFINKNDETDSIELRAKKEIKAGEYVIVVALKEKNATVAEQVFKINIERIYNIVLKNTGSNIINIERSISELKSYNLGRLISPGFDAQDYNISSVIKLS